MKFQIEPKDGFAGVDRTYKVLASLACFQDGQICIEDIADTVRAGPEHDHLTVCERSRHKEAGDQQPAVRFPELKAAGPLHKPFHQENCPNCTSRSAKCNQEISPSARMVLLFL